MPANIIQQQNKNKQLFAPINVKPVLGEAGILTLIFYKQFSVKIHYPFPLGLNINAIVQQLLWQRQQANKQKYELPPILMKRDHLGVEDWVCTLLLAELEKL